MAAVAVGSTVTVHYIGTMDNGEQFDSSYDRGEPIQFTVGSGNMIPGFDSGVIGMTVDEKKTIVVETEKAYGQPNPELVKTFSRSNFPEDYEFTIGAFVQAQSSNGQTAFAKITKIEDQDIDVDFNHPLAGKELTFELELISTETNNS